MKRLIAFFFLASALISISYSLPTDSANLGVIPNFNPSGIAGMLVDLGTAGFGSNGKGVFLTTKGCPLALPNPYVTLTSYWIDDSHNDGAGSWKATVDSVSPLGGVYIVGISGFQIKNGSNFPADLHLRWNLYCFP